MSAVIAAPPRMHSLSHAQVKQVDEQIFTLRFVSDCMRHACRCHDEGGRQLDDACCQHGADVYASERDAILARQAEIAHVLAPSFRDPARWFDESDAEEDPDAPGTWIVRTGRAAPEENGGCVFLEHDGRGCGLHRAALENGFAPEEIKPRVCRLYPLSYWEGALGLSDDFWRYSCADHAGPTLYRTMRSTLGSLFGDDLIAQLDRLEQGIAPRRLLLVARM